MGAISKGAGAPLYVQLIATFEAKIGSGEWTVGQRLPSERELCELFSVSRITVRRAMAEAEAKGLVERVHGVGNFVAAPKMRQSLKEVKSFEASLAEGGLVATTQILIERTEISDFSIAGILNVPVASPVQYLQVRGLGGEVPLVVYDSYFPGDIGESVLRQAHVLEDAGTPFSTLDIHRSDTANAQLTRMEQTLEAVVADEETGRLLDIEPGSPVFRVESVMHSPSSVLEYRIARYRGDKYKFAIERSAV